MNGVSWFLAFAFCAWDGGHLPTELEWEYAAAGGDENRAYPWGNAYPDATRANYYESAVDPTMRVGSFPLGAARWGQYDMAGSMWEWTMDVFDESWYANGGASCSDCAYLSSWAGANRAKRGGSWAIPASFMKYAYGDVQPLRTANRSGDNWSGSEVGFRCARSL